MSESTKYTDQAHGVTRGDSQDSRTASPAGGDASAANAVRRRLFPSFTATSWDGPEDCAVLVSGMPVGQSGLRRTEAERIARWLESAWTELAAIADPGARKVLCMHCDVAFVWPTDEAGKQRVWRDMLAHDAACDRNPVVAQRDGLLVELTHLVRLLEPLEQSGALNIPGLATLNGARAALQKASGH